MRLGRIYGWWLVSPALLMVTAFFVAPLLYFLRFSFQIPSRTQFSAAGFTTANYVDFFTDSFFVETLARTIGIAAVATAMALLLALPVAYTITTTGGTLKLILIVATVFPLLVGNLIRSIGWSALLGYSGVVNTLLTKSGLTSGPLDILQTVPTLTLVLATIVLPIMILTLQASMEGVDPATTRAALSLGARPLQAFRQVMLPQIIPGIVAGTSLVFVLVINAYATPVLIGGSQVSMLAPEVYATITSDNNWPFGAAMAAILLVVTLSTIVLYGWLLRRQFEGWRRVAP